MSAQTNQPAVSTPKPMVSIQSGVGLRARSQRKSDRVCGDFADQSARQRLPDEPFPHGQAMLTRCRHRERLLVAPHRRLSSTFSTVECSTAPMASSAFHASPTFRPAARASRKNFSFVSLVAFSTVAVPSCSHNHS